MKFKKLILAGTFDHFHLGHQQFLRQSLAKTEFAFCGLTTDWVKKNKIYNPSLQPFSIRLKTIKKFLKENNLFKKVKLFPLNNPFGPTLSPLLLEALATTKESFARAKIVNQKRKEKGLKPLSLVLTNLVLTNDRKRLSSTRIRKGEINRQGLIYEKLFNQKTIFLKTSKRRYLKKPLGKLITGLKNNFSWAGVKTMKNYQKNKFPLIISVGDITTQTLSQYQLPINLAIVDFRSQRKKINFNLHHNLQKKSQFIFKAENKPATISLSAITKIKQALIQIKKQKQAILKITGEEDLLVLPAILLAPLQTVIFYGQPNQGIVQIIITEKIKEKAVSLLKKFFTVKI